MNNQLASVSESAFLPANYVEPKFSKYMKLVAGKNSFRILGSAIYGKEYWITTADGKRNPVRVRMDVRIDSDELEINPETGKQEEIKVFWAFPVWNYSDQRVQILHLTQKTIRNDIKSYFENPKWGDVRAYDFTVDRQLVNGKTVYQTTVDPKSPIPPEAVSEYAGMYINLNALFDNKDPFMQEIESSAAPEEEYVDPEEVDQGLQLQDTQAKVQARTVAQKYRR